MVSDTVLGAIIGVSGAIIGSFLTGLFGWLSTRQRIQAENSRRLAEFYIEDKVDALTDVHSKLIEVEQSFTRSSLQEEESAELEIKKADRGEILSCIAEYQFSIAKATIYLEYEQVIKLRLVVDELYGILRESEGDINFVREEKLSDIIGTIHDGRDILKEEIGEPIDSLEN